MALRAKTVQLLLFAISLLLTSAEFKFSHEAITMGVDFFDVTGTMSSANPQTDLKQKNSRILSAAQESLTLNQELDVKYGNYSYLFKGGYNYPANHYIEYDGLDDTSLFSSQIVVKKELVFVGMSGYNSFTGAVSIYRLKSKDHWELEQLISSPCGTNSNFGVSLAQDGNWLVVGANAYDSFNGAAFIYKIVQSHWILHTKIYSPLQDPSQGFGFKVAIHGNLLVISTAKNDVFVYEYIKGQWNRNQPSQFEAPPVYSQFGYDIAIYNDLVVVGAPNFTSSVGAVYVYQRQSPGNWSILSIIQSITGWNSRFGHSVSIFESTIVVGAIGYEYNTYHSPGRGMENNTGKVYIFDLMQMGSPDYAVNNSSGNPTGRRLNALSWQLSQTIPSLLGRSSYFGSSVAIHKNSLVIGANGFPYSSLTQNAEELGAAFIFYKDTMGTWQLTYSLSSPSSKGGNFGACVAIHDDYVAIGAFTAEGFRGSLFLANIPLDTPDSNDGGSNNEDINSLMAVGKSWHGAYVILALLGLLAVIIAATMAYCFYCCAAPPPIVSKKKKKEEEESPYTVHSYTGYCEIDDLSPAIPPVPFQQHQSPYSRLPGVSSFHQQPIMQKDPDIMKKDLLKKEEYGQQFVDKGDGSFIIERADESFIRRLFPYKVYGPRGYVEGQNAEEFTQMEINKKIDDENALMKQSSVSRVSLSTASSFKIDTVENHHSIVYGEHVDSVLDGLGPSTSDQTSSFSSGNYMALPAQQDSAPKRRYGTRQQTASNVADVGVEWNSISNKEMLGRHRFQEEAKIRAEEKARERFAIFKAQNEEIARASKDLSPKTAHATHSLESIDRSERDSGSNCVGDFEP